MFTIIVFLILSIFQTNQALIGYHLIPESKLQLLTKNDPAFSLTFEKVNKLFSQHCGLKIKGITSVSYKIVQGIKYNMVLDTIYGPLHVIGTTQYWQKLVNITEMKLLSVETEQNSSNTTLNHRSMSQNIKNQTKISQISPTNFQIKGSSINNDVNIDDDKKDVNKIDKTEYLFPLLRSQCVHMQFQLDELGDGQGHSELNTTKQQISQALFFNKTNPKQKQNESIQNITSLTPKQQIHTSIIETITNANNPINIIILTDNHINETNNIQIISNIAPKQASLQHIPTNLSHTTNI